MGTLESGVVTGGIVVVSLGPELDMGSVRGRRKNSCTHKPTRNIQTNPYTYKALPQFPYDNKICKQIPMVVMLETYAYMAHSTVHIDHLKRIKPIPVMTVMTSLASDTTSPTTARMMNLLLELGASGIRRTVTLEVATQ